ncbi:hypothetical protein AP060_00973 [Pseudomonas sp. TAD18]|nr:hypothetical protein AP060_00973 [Pseudomonas sp. TAD18]
MDKVQTLSDAAQALENSCRSRFRNVTAYHGFTSVSA